MPWFTSGDDLSEFTKTDGSRPFTGTVAGVTPTAAAHLATKAYVDSLGGGASATHIWKPLLDDDGAIVVNEDGDPVMGFAPA